MGKISDYDSSGGVNALDIDGGPRYETLISSKQYDVGLDSCFQRRKSAKSWRDGDKQAIPIGRREHEGKQCSDRKRGRADERAPACFANHLD
ncbi:hypothetical protein ABG82_09850 [Mycobacteroides immunogenum]|nr:hypothetical protein ABG82_09850 [Mycobacteroides immunogenum]ANO03654.1 hypothetical protein BAB75_09905 [Mycobacteroides immunogenum]KPG04312.1 hypothetical protein AN909_23985 [Mycobacteroides immunogenum]KPG05695.1 hypothetical protein AN910_23725 [Mycobacteroides immunogenum]KPG19265.1 hypothetical protein AN911_24145 [Mycobacteroides immunogenum]